MRINRMEFEAALKFQIKSLKESPLPSREDRVLFTIGTTSSPGWEIFGVSLRHRKDLVSEHLFLKGWFDDINKNEIRLAKMMALGGEGGSIFQLILEEVFLLENVVGKNLPFFKMLYQSEDGQIDEDLMKRRYRSFVPELRIFKRFREKPKFPPVRYIGVGHQESGHSQSTLSWKEMMTLDGEIEGTELELLLLLLRLFKEMPL